VRHLIADSLLRQGFSVTTAEDGAEALELAQKPESRFDMLVTDYDMPRMTGFELVHALKRDPKLRDIPTLMLTARDTRRDQAQMRAVGLTSYLVKPFSVDKCVAIVERVLAERRLIAYKEASRLYISDGAVRAAEDAARSGQLDRDAVRAESREMAVLFSDICGFTSMSCEMQPMEVVELLNSFFDVMCPVLKAEAADIDKFIGDAIMALFDELPDGDSAPLRAVRAALAMQAALAEWNRQHGHALVFLLLFQDLALDRQRRERRHYGLAGGGRMFLHDRDELAELHNLVDVEDVLLEHTDDRRDEPSQFLEARLVDFSGREHTQLALEVDVIGNFLLAVAQLVEQHDPDRKLALELVTRCNAERGR